MDFGQNMRRHWREMRARAADTHARASDAANEHLNRLDFVREWRWQTAQGIGIAILVVILLVYPLAAWLDSTIDDNPDFSASAKAMAQGRSHAVANAVGLINREVNKHGWTANAPWFWPTALLDDMPNYQKGIVEALGRFAFEMTDQIGRARGTSEADLDLQSAAGLLQYPPDVWVWDPSVSIWPTATSTSQYRKAMKSLRQYNQRLASHQAVFDTHTDNLQYTLDRIAADLGSSSAAIQDHLEHKSGWPFDATSDDVFYTTKGQMYAYYIVLKGLQADFADVIRQRDLGKPWASMMESFRNGISLKPMVVLNGAPDSDVFACTLCGEGFYVARARAQLREIKDILQQ